MSDFLLDDGALRVTAREIQAGGRTFAVAHVAGVALERGRGMGWALAAFLLAGVFILAQAHAVSLLLFALAAAQAVRVVRQWRVVLRLSDGSRHAVVLYQRATAERLAGAIGAALGAR